MDHSKKIGSKEAVSLTANRGGLLIMEVAKLPDTLPRVSIFQAALHSLCNTLSIQLVAANLNGL